MYLFWILFLFGGPLLPFGSPLPFDPWREAEGGAGQNETLPHYTLLQQQRTRLGGGHAQGTQIPNCQPQTICSANRDKEMRLMSIKNYVLSSLGIGKVPSSQTKPVGLETSKPFSGQISTLSPSCEVPLNVDPEMWSSEPYFHIFFNLTKPEVEGRSNGSKGPPTPSQKSTISAKLRVFKIGMERRVVELNGTEGAGSLGEMVREKLRVSLYWYRAPLTKRHYKKKLLDTRMVSASERGWVELDLLNAAVPWLEKEGNNFGLVLELEDEENEALDPNRYFLKGACGGGGAANDSWVMGAPDGGAPVLEICTLSSPFPHGGGNRGGEVEEGRAPFIPYPRAQSFSYLSRVAKAHAATPSPFSSQMDLVPSTPPAPLSSQVSGAEGGPVTPPTTPPPSFHLDKDHPLRLFLERNLKNVDDASRRRGWGVKRVGAGGSGGLGPFRLQPDSEEDVIIQKIYIRNQSPTSLLNR